MNLIQETSTEAYNDVKPELGIRQTVVFEGLKKLQEATNLEISVNLNIPINQVTPRIFELRQMGLVREKEKRECKISGRKAIAWEITKLTLF